MADYVLGSYGSGAIMAVPGHDTRDFEFAEAFDLAVKRVVQSPTEERPKLPYTGQYLPCAGFHQRCCRRVRDGVWCKIS